jgi:DNA-binding NarL/FixJ family response regulator
VIRVALVDDQQLVRAGFRMVIDSQDDLQVVAQASDGAEAVRVLT